MKHAVLTLLLVLLCQQSRADSWISPTERVYASASGKFLLYVAPKALSDYATLFQLDKQSPGAAMGFRKVWRTKLVNKVAPLDAYISDDGRFVVTTNEYGNLGYGDNVVVIYDARGSLIRRFRLSEFIPEANIKRIPQTVSSIYWFGQHRIDTKVGLLHLQVWQSGDPFMKQPIKYRAVTVRLSTGEILTPAKVN